MGSGFDVAGSGESGDRAQLYCGQEVEWRTRGSVDTPEMDANVMIVITDKAWLWSCGVGMGDRFR
jgi:hypothetical protein